MGTYCSITNAFELGCDDQSVRARVFDRVSFVVSFPFLFATEEGVLRIVHRRQDQSRVRVLGLDRNSYPLVPGGLWAPLRGGVVMEKIAIVSYGMGTI